MVKTDRKLLLKVFGDWKEQETLLYQIRYADDIEDVFRSLPIQGIDVLLRHDQVPTSWLRLIVDRLTPSQIATLCQRGVDDVEVLLLMQRIPQYADLLVFQVKEPRYAYTILSDCRLTEPQQAHLVNTVFNTLYAHLTLWLSNVSPSQKLRLVDHLIKTPDAKHLIPNYHLTVKQISNMADVTNDSWVAHLLLRYHKDRLTIGQIERCLSTITTDKARAHTLVYCDLSPEQFRLMAYSITKSKWARMVLQELSLLEDHYLLNQVTKDSDLYAILTDNILADNVRDKLIRRIKTYRYAYLLRRNTQLTSEQNQYLKKVMDESH